MAEPAPDPVVLDDAAIEQRLALLDEVLGQLEQMPGRTAELALDAVETLTEVYGEALRRVVAAAERRPALLTAYTSDELLRHLLLLHGIHPDPVAVRAARAVEDLAPHLRSLGASAQVTGVQDGVAYVTVSSGSCGSCGGHDDVAELIRRHVGTMAPDLERIEISPPAAVPALIPVDTLLRPPVSVAGGPR